MNAKERALALYQEHIELAKTDGRLFRKTIMETLQKEFPGMSVAGAATHYNNAKKANPVEGLGRAPVPAGVRRPGGRGKKQEPMLDDNECFSVLELVGEADALSVARCQSFAFQGEAGETFERKAESWPNSIWVLIQGLGPNSGDSYRLEPGEKEIRRYTPEVAQQPVTA